MVLSRKPAGQPFHFFSDRDEFRIILGKGFLAEPRLGRYLNKHEYILDGIDIFLRG